MPAPLIRLRITMLGTFEARLIGGPSLAPPTRKAEALLAYVAVHPDRACPREQLTALLWGDLELTRARHNLRQTLVALKKTLADIGAPMVLSVRRDVVALNPPMVDVDVAAFQTLVASDEAADVEEAAALYRGEFLTGFDVGETAFEEWLMSERVRLRELALRGLAKLLAHQIRQGNLERAVQTGLRALAIDPLQEDVHRALMRLFVGQHRRAAALQQYQACVTTLRRELGVDPEPETKELYQEILRQSPSVASTVGMSSADSTRDDRPARVHERAHVPPLVGRESELARLSGLFDDVGRGQMRAAVILGEAGIGKTRLLEEFVAAAREGPVRVLPGRCYESLQPLPFGPWVDALRAAGLGRDERLIDALSPVWRVELARLFPELGKPGLVLSTSPENLIRLFEAIAALLAHLAVSTPLVVVVEDLHWADEMTLRLLAFLTRRLTASRLLLLVTAREEEVQPHALLARILEEMLDSAPVERIPLSTLFPSDALALVRALAAADDQARIESIAQRIWTLSEGNPLIIVETMKAIRESDLLQDAAELPLPRRVRDVVARRLERLGELPCMLAAVAAVIGREFEFALIGQATGLSETAAAEGVEELVRQRMLQSTGERLEFTHDWIREAVYDATPPRSRRALHAAVAGAIEVLHGHDLEPAHARLAHHYVKAEEPAKAITYLTLAAAGAARSYAHEEALKALEHACSLVDLLPPDTGDRLLVDLVCRRTQSLTLLGRGGDALQLLLAHRSLADRIEDPAVMGPYYAWLAFVYNGIGNHEETVQQAQRALELATRADDRPTMGRALYVLAFDAFWHGQPSEGIEHGQRAVQLLESWPHERFWLAATYWSLGLNQSILGEFDRALTALERAEELAASSCDLMLHICVAATRALVYGQMGDQARAVEVGETNLRRPVNPWGLATASAFLGGAYVELGEGGEAIAALEQPIAIIKEVRFPKLQAWFSSWMSEGLRLDGQLERARDLAMECLDLAGSCGYRYAAGHAQRTLGLIAYGEGRLADARVLLQDALQTYASTEARYFAARALSDLARVAHSDDDRQASARFLGEAYAMFSALRVPVHLERVKQLADELGVPTQWSDTAGPGQEQAV